MRAYLAFLTVCLALLSPQPAAAAACDLVWRDEARGRALPLRIDLPPGSDPKAGRGRVPAVIWSPGVGGGIGNASRWVQAWTAAGIAVIRLQHPGSDAAVYAGPPSAERNRRVRAAASPEQQRARIGDVGFIIGELTRRQTAKADDCAIARIDPDRLGLAGHSVGAWVAQAMAGQQLGGSTALADRRLRAFMIFSGTGPADPAEASASFGSIARPLLVVTGSRDGVNGKADPDSSAFELSKRTAPFTGAPADGRKALLVLTGADHMIFAGDQSRNPAKMAMHNRIAAISALWLRRWLLGDESAEAALARPTLDADDRWERK